MAPRTITSLSALQEYMPLTDDDVIITCKMLISDLTPTSMVVIVMLFTRDIRRRPSGLVQVMLGLGRPEAVQVNVAVLGNVTSSDEGYSVMLAATVIKI